MKKVVFRIISLSLVILIVGCSEADFYLSPDSRLPKWFDVPEGKKRENYTVKLSYYIYTSGREATLKFKEKGAWLATKKIVVKMRGLEPITLNDSSSNRYPSYEIITGNEITDIIEHRDRNNIFHMVDSPAVWEELLGINGVGDK
jgi:hypothetical protein